jgi:hypothetical protein
MSTLTTTSPAAVRHDPVCGRNATDAAATRHLTARWLALALFALGAASVAAILMVLVRMPVLQGFFDAPRVFPRLLVVHVDLATIAWFLTAAAAFATAASGGGLAGIARAGWAVVAAGVAVLVAAPVVDPAQPVLSNYVPAFDSAPFFAALAAIATGVSLTLVRALVAGPGPGPSRMAPWRDAARAAMLPLAAILLATLLALPVLGGAPDRGGALEAFFWPIGHAAQFFHLVWLLAAWQFLATEAGIGASVRTYRAALAATVLPAFAIPVVLVAAGPGSAGARAACTLVMAWGSWPGALLLGAAIVRRIRARARGMPAFAPFALAASAGLFATGLVLGAAIRGDSAMVPAHYHGTIGAITVAFMAAFYRLAAVGDAATGTDRGAMLQLGGYAAGLALFVAGLGWAGVLGATRKGSVASGALAEGGPALLVAAGAALGVLSAIAFVALMVRRLRGSGSGGGGSPGPHEPRRPPSRDHRLRAIVVATLAIGTVGALIAWWPAEEAPTRADARHTADPRRDPAGHAAAARRAEVADRFQQAVIMLHARRYDHALTALHRVLELEPAMPEAHVNMGFALIGLERHAAARDFFEAATALRAGQVNAYYGLALAHEALGDRASAIGAMRTFVHLAPKDDPALRKANAALWEWESARDAARSPG